MSDPMNAAPSDTATPPPPVTLKRFRVYRAKLAMPDNPLSEHFILSYLSNMGFETLSVSGDAESILIVGRYMGVDGFVIPKDDRLTVTEASA